MKQYIPNALTLLNLLCGSIAVLFVVNDNFVAGALFVFLGIFFDFFDGFAARKFNVQSELGLQLDSLADVVTSGLVPGVVMYKLLELSDGTILQSIKSSQEWTETMYWVGGKIDFFPLLGLAITLASAYRLAKFNIDTEQQNYFKGLPTPANALLIISLPLILEFQDNDTINDIILNKWFLMGITVFSCWILNSKIKLFALKFKNFSFKDNATRYIFIILCMVLLIVLQFAALPIIILLYIAMSVLDGLTSK
ncbi:CDP-alcohol phosphatidyltransferase family protein [Hyunsoonleella pacifica]|uniref:Phosphatidylserine synthase n=1 Tax=Hyunsoonleella pacifica TaxID=1080224 RepID=A0A4Q9FRA1_9FLAO|nr:CDP-alcohol phosphatidyltransferase family protein [Hyunsoonleella pacifica]TBN18534.1 phosphatidylserine synthase [Hyunsoonleella pacifica]GGD02597.1 phosphatidylserine synthase [Hyunsoonleella pacifica]